MSPRRLLSFACAVVLACFAAPASAETTLRVVMHSDLKIVDPIWTTAYIVRNQWDPLESTCRHASLSIL